MSKNRYLHIVFSENIQAYEIPYFRAAVIEKSKRESNLFHNHLDNEKVIYRYPLIQYKIKDRKPSIICLNEATEDIHYLLKQKNFDFQIGNRKESFEIEDVRLKYEIIQTWKNEFEYSILNWMALNQENFEIYKSIKRYGEKIEFLNTLLIKHIRIFMESMNYEETKPLEVSITSIIGDKFIEYKNIFHQTFSLTFTTNLSIPNYIGLGKGVSVGFGIVRKKNQK